MGILNKLFGKTPARPPVSGKMSLYGLTLQQKGNLSSRRCGIDGATFPCPSITLTVITTRIEDFALDVGGYCDNCKAFRCHNHLEFQADGVGHTIICTHCRRQVRGVGS